MANISSIKLPNGTTYTLKDNGALQLTGGQVTGPVTFGDTVSIDEATLGDLVVNGSASFTNNLQVNTINGVTVGNSPKFTDTLMTVTTTGNGNAVTAVSASGTVITVTKGATYSNNAGTITGVTAGTGLSGGGTSGSVTLNHSNSITAGTAGTSSATSGATLAVPYITYDSQGHITATGTHTHTISGFLTSSSTLNAGKLSGTIPADCYIDTKTFYVDVVKDGNVYDIGDASSLDIYNAVQNNETVILRDEAGNQFNLFSVEKESNNSATAIFKRVSNVPEAAGMEVITYTILPDSVYYDHDLRFLQETIAGATGTLSTTWTSNQQTITVHGVTGASNIIVTPTPDSYDAYCEAGIYCSAQASNSLTFKCDTVPSVSLTVNIMIIN